MKGLPISFALACLATGIVIPALGQTPGAAAPAGDKVRGQQTYLRFGCYQCHGTVGQGASERFGPKIAPSPLPYSYFEHQLRNPRNPIQTYTPMPVYTAKVLDAQQVADIYAYLASVPPAKKVEDIPLLKDLKK